jgi:hypothetical protein
MTADLAAIVAFIEARLAEDKAAAKACPLEHWEANGPPRDGRYIGPPEWYLVGRVDAHTGHLLAEGSQIHDRDHVCLIHAARHDPARVLRDVEAKRAILMRYETACRQADVAAVDGGGPEQQAWEKIAGALELDVRSLATVWSDHPEYQEGWKP